MRTQKSALIVIAATIAISGCIEIKPLRQPPPEKQYVSNIGAGETVMVIPFNDYIDQIEMARNLEMALIGFGFNVRSYQVDIKEIEKRTGSGVAGARAQGDEANSSAIGAESKEVTIERYRSYEKINADYAFEILLNDYQGLVKVVKTKDKSVVAVCEYHDSSIEDDVKECLEKRKLIVGKTP